MRFDDAGSGPGGEIVGENAAEHLSRAAFLSLHRQPYEYERTGIADRMRKRANDKQMGDLHKQFLHIAGPTDILTFPLDVNAKNEPIGGELVICVPHARRAAKTHGVVLKNELLLYALHGMLHLAGFDDRTAAQYNRMHRIEDEILAQLGVGPVFHPSARQGRARGEG